MANAAGFVQESIWRDPHWRTLSRTAQTTYMQLLSQKELDCAGVLPLQPNKWAKGCDHISVDDIWADLELLQRERFVFFDTETDELFVRAYIRRSNVLKVPNMLKSALRSAVLVGSELIRTELAAELRATGRVEADLVADKINPSGTLPEPLANGSDLTPPEPFAKPTGVGVGKGTGVTSQGTYVGEPPPACNSHPNDPDKPCRKCQRRREWDEQNADLAAERAAAERRMQRLADAKGMRDCPHCDDYGWVTGVEPAEKCVLHPIVKPEAV